MMDFVSAPNWLLLSVRVFMLMIVILSVYNAVKALYLHLGTANIIYSLIFVSITCLLFIDVSVLLESRYFDNRVTYFAKIIGNMPCIVVVIFSLVLAIGNFLIAHKLTYHSKNAITAETVKCTMDGMDDGICFFYENGETILVNVKMNKISSELFGTEIMNGQLFWKNILSGNYKSGVLLESNNGIFIETSDKRVCDVRFEKNYVRNVPICSVTAYDITEQSRLYREVKSRNTILSNMNKHLKDYNKAIKQVVADKETLAVKIRVHDDLGRFLLAARNVLLNFKNEKEKNDLLNLWDEAVLVMKNEYKPEAPKDTFDLLMQAARSINAEIEIDGELPQEPKIRNLIIAAAHECLTNTVKHAQGDRVLIKIKEFDYYTQIKYFNNGELPSGPIKEIGGLSNLRNIVERAGGTMEIEIKPRFMLVVNVPKGEDLVWKK